VKLTLRTKLVGMLLVLGALPVAFNSFYAYRTSSQSLKELASEKMEAVRSVKGEAVKRYFETTRNQLLTFAHDLTVTAAMKDFRYAFKSFENENGISAVDRIALKAKLLGYYQKEFAAEYKKQNGKEIDSAALFNQLDDTGRALQSYYIASNPNPLGSKHLLDKSSDASMYSRLHGKYHPFFREYLATFGLYDIFLIDPKTGHVVYTVFKELDFGTSLISGPHAKTTLAEAFSKALTTNSKAEAVLVDFRPYAASYDAPASFIATGIYEGSELIGIAAFQMPIDRLNLIMGERAGMGTSGETYLVGSDGLLRSDTLYDKENRNVISSFRNPEKGAAKTQFSELALTGKSGVSIGKNYIGKEVISAYTPFQVLGLNWALLASVDTEEAFAATRTLRFAMVLLATALLSGVAVIAYFFSSWLSKQVESIAASLLDNARLVSDSSKEISSVSSQLSEAATEQASSLQETVSSINEISAMVKKNAQAAENSTQVASKSRQAAMAGKETVQTMIESIDEIATTNASIMNQMLESNQKIGDIVRVISEIGEKTKVINDIVFQTKLLSFNASVEAARAGEHGKGFAVVAEEVGNLASMSGSAAKEITEMLDSGTKKVTDIVAQTREQIGKLVEVGKSKVEQGTKTANACGEALDEILKHASSVNELVSEIAVASNEQSQGVSEVNKAMSQLDQVTQQNTGVAQDTAHMAAKLDSQADSLRTAVHALEKVIYGRSQEGTTAFEVKKPANVFEFPKKGKKTEKADRPAESGLKLAASGSSVPSKNDDRFEDV
jgi:methyl-accepting chemotaxis protein